MTQTDEFDAIAAMRAELATSLMDLIAISESDAADIAREVSDRLRAEYGGQEVYIRASSRRARDRAVLADFDGTNRNVVCKRHGISRPTFYRILARR